MSTLASQKTLKIIFLRPPSKKQPPCKNLQILSKKKVETIQRTVILLPRLARSQNFVIWLKFGRTWDIRLEKRSFLIEIFEKSRVNAEKMKMLNNDKVTFSTGRLS